MKRMLALMLAMLMLLHPMTAFAVQWQDVVTVLRAHNAYQENGLHVEVNDGAVTVNSGNVENFFHSGEFSAYTFKDTVTVGGDTFYVFVDDSQSVTVDIQSGAIISAAYGIASDVQGGNFVLNNNGLVADEIRINVSEGGTAEINQGGTVESDIVVNAEGESNTLTVNNTGKVQDDISIDLKGDYNNAVISNTGSIADEYDIDIYGSGNNANASNAGEVGGRMDAYIYPAETLDAEGNWIAAGTSSGNSINLTNSGTIAEDLVVSIEGEKNSASMINDGTVGVYMDSYITGNNNTVDRTNAGTVGDELYVDVMGNGNAVSTVNTGDVAEDIVHYLQGTGNTLTTSSSDDLTGWLHTSLVGEDNHATLISSGDTGSVELYVQGLGNSLHASSDGDIAESLYANADGRNNILNVSSSGDIQDSLFSQSVGQNAQSSVAHDGDVGNGVMIGATIGGQAAVQVFGSTGNALVISEEDSSATLGVTGGVQNPIYMFNEGKVTLMICAGNGSVIPEDVLAQIIENSVTYVDEPTGVLDVITTDNGGQKTARYCVAADGTVTLEEVYEQDLPDDDPANWSEDRIRHHKELERKAAAIGGVTGSPYWLKQLYLGYMSLNLRLFDGEEQLLFKESLSWQPDGSKLLTLNVRIANTSELMMRLDGMVIDKLKQAGISAITITNGNGDPFMTYAVSDLEGVRAMYDLGLEDYIVVGEATDDVMMIGADGRIVPIEGEQEAPGA